MKTTIAQIKRDRESLEKELEVMYEPIMKRLRAFEKETGTRISGVKFYHWRDTEINDLAVAEAQVDLILR